MSDSGLLSVDNGVDKVIDADATLIAKEYYTDYAKYVLEYRALPSVYDGLKPVQRRIIYTACQQPKKLMKTAKLSGLVLSLHPHGSASVTGSINNMAYPLNALPLFTTKGNFGSVNAGPSADRYTECYLSDIARMNFCQFVDYADYEVGEIGEMEPSSLPTLIPYALFEGSEGIAIGLSTKVMPLNLIDLIDYYIDYIKKDGKTKKSVKPDVGYVLLENEDIKDAVFSYKGKITTSSIVTQISDTAFLIEGLHGKSIDAVISKIDKWDKSFTKGQVGFRDASTTSMRYVFEIYDDKYPTAEQFKENLIWATRTNSTFTRVVEEDGSAIYSNLNYVVKKSLECLNRAIDKKISAEIERNQKQLTLYDVLRRCKELGLFNDISKISIEELVHKIIVSTDCSEEVAKEVVKKPISYLTRSHDEDEKDLLSQMDVLKNHDRKKYLVDLYKEFRKAVLPIYESKKHSISKSEVIENPCIKFENGMARVTDGDGEEFSNIVYFISDKGFIYKRSVGSLSTAEFYVETFNDDTIIGFVTDKYKYVDIHTRFSYKGWYGQSIIELSTVPKDRKVINFRDEDDEHITYISGLSRLTKSTEDKVKTRLSKTTFVKG